MLMWNITNFNSGGMSLTCKQCGKQLAGSSRFCPICGAAVDPEPSDVSQGQVTTAPSVSPTRRIALVVFPIVVVALVVVFATYITPSVHPVIREQPVVADEHSYDAVPVTMVDIEVKEVEGDLVFSLDDLRKHRLVRFTYTGGKTERAVMAYLAPDGRLVTAISLSEHCGSTEFTIKDNMIYCARCPSHWDMMTMEAYACCAKYYPDPIPSRVVGADVHVAKEDVNRWAGRL